MADIQGILKPARSKQATDVHIVAGSPILLRVDGELTPVAQGSLTAKAARSSLAGR